jgi:hypothetical protein
MTSAGDETYEAEYENLTNLRSAKRESYANKKYEVVTELYEIIRK